nr:tetratricopeptide repeat protein [Ningiella ruwaisensis]
MKTNSQYYVSKGIFTLCAIVMLSAIGSIGVVGSIFYSPVANAQAEVKLGERETRRTPALRSRVYEQLARAQSAGDAGNVEEAISILDEVKDKADSMNSYERAMMYNFYGFIYYNEERYDETIESFKAAISESPIPVSFEQTTVFSLAQLSMMQGNYDEVVEYLERWEALNDGKIPPKNYILKAQALYQKKDYEAAIDYIEQAIENHEAEGYLPDENWLVLQRAIYYELKQPEKVKEVIAKLIRLYDQPKYWIQLAGMYGELEREEEQLATMEIAYQRGFITSASDTFNLAQLYYYHGVPYKGAKLMEVAIASGVLEENLRNLKFLAQSWQLAKEDEKAIPVLMQAAQMSDDGELDAQLALLYFNTESYDKAIASAKAAIEKGDLDNPGNTHMVLGLALYNQRQFSQALDELAKAEEFAGSRGAARQWSQYVEREKNDFEARLAIENAS